MEIPILKDIIIILGLAVLVVWIFQKLKLPTILGFLFTGVIAGSNLFNLVDSTHEVETLAEIGVILLLFTIGLEFSLAHLASIKKYVFFGGALQVGITIAAVYFISSNLGFNTGEAIFLGFLFSLSSTAIVLKIFQSRGEIDTQQGKTALAVLIFQDIIVVPMMLFTPMLTGETSNWPRDLLILALKGAAVILMVIVSARYLVPKVLHLIAQTRSKELFILSIVVICFAVAWMTSSIGLSLALGAFLAGLIISESEYSHQAVSNILPFHEIFSSFFFISIGMLLDVKFFIDNIIIVIFLVICTLFIKTFIASGTGLLLKLPLRTALVSGFALFQVGEFSFILSLTGIQNNVLSPEVNQFFLSVSILTMAITPFVINITSKWVEGLKTPPFIAKIFPHSNDSAVDPNKKKTLSDHLIIVGFGINGKNVALAARHAGINYVIVELNADTVKHLKNKEPIIFGDAVQSGVLDHINTREARVMVIAISDPIATKRIIANARSFSDKLYIIVRTRYIQEVNELFKLGANEVIPEEFETSIEIFARVLNEYLVPKEEIHNFIKQVRESGYNMFRGLSVDSVTNSPFNINLSGADVASLRVTEKCEIAGKSLGEAEIRKKFKITILALRKPNTMITNPGPDEIISPGDLIYVFGHHSSINSFQEVLSPTDKKN